MSSVVKGETIDQWMKDLGYYTAEFRAWGVHNQEVVMKVTIKNLNLESERQQPLEAQRM